MIAENKSDTPDPRIAEMRRYWVQENGKPLNWSVWGSAARGEKAVNAIVYLLDSIAALQQRVEQVTAELVECLRGRVGDAEIIGRHLSALEAAERNASLAIKARDAYDEERRQSYQAMCGWKGRAEAAEARIASLRGEKG